MLDIFYDLSVSVRVCLCVLVCQCLCVRMLKYGYVSMLLGFIHKCIYILHPFWCVCRCGSLYIYVDEGGFDFFRM